MPNSPAARGEELYFCVKRADMEENRYFSDLWLWKGGAAKRLTSSGDVNGFWLTEAGVVFSALRGKRDKERAEAGEPLTVLQLLPYDGGEARELCRLPCAVTALRFAGEGRFFFTADCSRDWDAALAQAQGDAKAAAEALKRSRAECRVIDELPFWFNGRGFVNGCRSRLGVYENGAHRFLTGENTDVSLGGLSPDGKKLSFTASDWTGSAPIEDRLCLLDTDTLEIEDVTVREGAQHYWSLPLGGGRLAALVNTMDKYGINENPKLFLREGGAWRLVLGDGAHCFGSSVGSDVKADSGFCGDARERASELFFLDTQGGETQLLAVDEESGEDRLQLVAVDAVLIQADGDYLRAVEVEGLERGEVAGLLDGHGVAGVNERRGDHVQRLLGAVRDDDVFGREIHALLLIAVGDKLAQRHVALGVAVLQGAYAVPLKDLRDRGLHLLYRKGVGVRKPAGKGYDIRRRGGLKYGRGEFALKVGLGHAVRDPELHFLFLLLASLFSREWILFAIIEKMIAPCP